MNDRGSAMPMALALLLGGALLVATVVDLGRLGSTWVEAQRAARTAAEAGAGVVRTGPTRRNNLIIDVPAAETVAASAARRARPGHGRSVIVSATRSEVCVEIRQPFSPGAARVIGARALNLVARACAEPRSG